MPKNVKKPADRKNEFIEEAQTLFVEKGYEGTSVDDIVAKMGVAKGLFYYYFDSKEELLAIIAHRLLDEIESSIVAAMDKKGLTAVERFQELFNFSADITERSKLMATYFHSEMNQTQHQAMEEKSKAYMLPIIVQLIEQGIGEGTFHTDYPKETAIALIASSVGIKHSLEPSMSPEEMVRTTRATQSVIERLLGAKPGTFAFFLEKLPLA
jgi:AcrR family transcriptional regulator